LDTYVTTVERDGVDDAVAAIIARHATLPLVAVLRALMQEYGHLSEGALRALAADRLVSLSRLYSLVSSYDDLRLEQQYEEALPAGKAAPLPEQLEESASGATGLLQGGPITARFEAPARSLEEYRAAGGMKAWKRARDLGSSKLFSEIVLGPITRQPDAWQRVASAGGDAVIVANCHGGDPLARQEDLLLERDPYSIVEGVMVAGQAISASRGFIYTRPLPGQEVERLQAIVAEMTALADSGIAIEVIAGPASLVAAESSVVVAVIDGLRPVPNVSDFSARGIWGRPTLVDTGECFAAIAAVIGGEEEVNTRLYQLTGAVERAGIIEAEASSSVRDLMEIAGARPGAEALVGGLSGRFLTEGEVDQEMLHLKPAIGPRWRLIHVLEDPRDIYPMAVQTAAYNAASLCGACVPCRIGSVRMAEMIPEYLVDFDKLEELARTLELTGLCLTGRGAAAMISSALRYVS